MASVAPAIGSSADCATILDISYAFTPPAPGVTATTPGENDRIMVTGIRFRIYFRGTIESRSATSTSGNYALDDIAAGAVRSSLERILATPNRKKMTIYFVKYTGEPLANDAAYLSTFLQGWGLLQYGETALDGNGYFTDTTPWLIHTRRRAYRSCRIMKKLRIFEKSGPVQHETCNVAANTVLHTIVRHHPAMRVKSKLRVLHRQRLSNQHGALAYDLYDPVKYFIVTAWPSWSDRWGTNYPWSATGNNMMTHQYSFSSWFTFAPSIYQ